MTSASILVQVTNSRSASFELQRSIRVANNRDPVDALHDAETLLQFCKLRAQEVIRNFPII